MKEAGLPFNVYFKVWPAPSSQKMQSPWYSCKNLQERNVFSLILNPFGNSIEIYYLCAAEIRHAWKLKSAI